MADPTVTDQAIRQAAVAIRDEREGWNRPHKGVMEPSLQDNAEATARVALAAAVPVLLAALADEIEATISDWNDGALTPDADRYMNARARGVHDGVAVVRSVAGRWQPDA